jgi:hypothetical protein
MLVVDLLGAVLSLVSLGFLALGGYLAALLSLGPEAERDSLATTVASLLFTTAQAVTPSRWQALPALLSRCHWSLRMRQLAAGALCAALFGSYFYLRNIALGSDALAVPCGMTASARAAGDSRRSAHRRKAPRRRPRREGSRGFVPVSPAVRPGLA